MRKKLVWYITIALLGVLALNEYHSQAEQVAVLRTEIARLRAQQDRFASQAARFPVVVRTQVATTAEPAMVRGTPAPPTQKDGGPGDPRTQDNQRDETAQARTVAVAEAFTTEPTNDAWATPTRTGLRDHLSSMLQNSSFVLRNIDCRSSTCRVDVVCKDVDVTRKFVETALTDPNADVRLWNGPAVVTRSEPNPDGSVAVAMYLAREGTSLFKPER